jgi:hypothetical protein
MTELDPRLPRTTVSIGGASHPAAMLDLSGHAATFRSSLALAHGAFVRVCLHWQNGATTTLRSTVSTVVSDPGCDPVTHARVLGIEGDWRPFLAHVGMAAASR